MMRSISRSKARRSPSSENSPASSRDQMAWNVAVGLEDAEQVVEAVVEGVRIALDVEEQVARRGRRQRGEAALRLDLLARRGQEQLVREPPVAAALELDARLLADARRAPLRRRPSSGGSIGSGEVAERLERRDAALASGLAAGGR